MSDVAPPVAQQWYLARGGQQTGPLSHQQLLEMVQQGRLHADDLLWTPGYDNWRPASSIPGLLKPPPLMKPPPIPASEAQLPASETQLTWKRAEELLPGMTAEINAFIEAKFTRAREEGLTILR